MKSLCCGNSTNLFSGIFENNVLMYFLVLLFENGKANQIVSVLFCFFYYFVLLFIRVMIIIIAKFSIKCDYKTRLFW